LACSERSLVWLAQSLRSTFAEQPIRRSRASRGNQHDSPALSNLNHAFSAQEGLLDGRPQPVKGLDQGAGAASPCDRRFQVRGLKSLRRVGQTCRFFGMSAPLLVDSERRIHHDKARRDVFAHGGHIRAAGLSPVVYSDTKELCYAGHSASCFHREAS
jgi:hypothetical protein